MIQILLQGFGVGIALAAPVGPINLEIIRRGIRGQFAHAWFTGFGAVCADSLICVLVVVGALRVVENPWVRSGMFVAGAVVLVLLGLRGLAATVRDEHQEVAIPRHGNAFLTGFAMAALNPMGIVYWLSIGSALIAAAIDENGTGAGPVLVAGVFAGTVTWITVLSTFITVGKSRFAPWAPRVIGAVSSGLLIVFGAYFGWRAINELMTAGGAG